MSAFFVMTRNTQISILYKFVQQQGWEVDQ